LLETWTRTKALLVEPHTNGIVAEAGTVSPRNPASSVPLTRVIPSRGDDDGPADGVCVGNGLRLGDGAAGAVGLGDWPGHGFTTEPLVDVTGTE